MKRIIFPLLVLVIIFISAGVLISQTNAEDQKFQKSIDKYMEEYWKFYPTWATIAGFHKFDAEVEDFSSRSIEKRNDVLDDFNQEFITKIDKTMLSPDFQIDHELIIDGLDLDLQRHEQLVPWEYNPLLYNTIFNFTIRALINDESVSMADRAKNAEKRLKNLPKLIKQGQDNLKTPAQIYPEPAIAQFPIILNFYKSELPQWIEQAPADSKSKLQQSLDKVIPDLEAYQTFLKNELLARSTGTFRYGEAHPRLMRNTLQNNLPTQELVARAKADVNNIRREMFLACISLYKIMDPRINIEQPPSTWTEEQLYNHVITHVLDKIEGDHVAQDKFMDAIKASMVEVKSFLAEKDIIELPDAQIAIEELSAFNQQARWYRLSVPGIYKTDGAYAFQIAPIPADKADGYLEEYNNFLLPFWTVSDVYPGSFVPTIKTANTPSLVKKMFANKPLLTGWPLMLGDVMVKAGFRNYDIRVRLNQLKHMLRGPIDFMVEYQVHESDMNKERAISYLTLVGLRTEAEAGRTFDEITLNPGTAAYPYVGYQELIDMHNQYMGLKGDAYSFKAFMNDVLSFGPIPIRSLKAKLVQ
ncbi:MAG: DUF885 domain-containing protein [Acidobacteria bacterium]|nr:DUF885 domain-containing protein [Acidobacteriota bacterium]